MARDSKPYKELLQELKKSEDAARSEDARQAEADSNHGDEDGSVKTSWHVKNMRPQDKDAIIAQCQTFISSDTMMSFQSKYGLSVIRELYTIAQKKVFNHADDSEWYKEKTEDDSHGARIAPPIKRALSDTDDVFLITRSSGTKEKRIKVNHGSENHPVEIDSTHESGDSDEEDDVVIDKAKGIGSSEKANRSESTIAGEGEDEDGEDESGGQEEGDDDSDEDSNYTDSGEE